MARKGVLDRDEYFAAKPAEDLVDILVDRENHFYKSVYSSGYIDKIHRLYAMYHGMSYYDTNNGHEIVFEGEQGELASISVNHLRNIATNMLNLVTASKPAIETRAINTDYKSRVQTKLANGLLDYYLREKRIEKRLKKATEHAVALSAGYIRLAWNATDGEQIDYDEELEVPIYEGDINAEVLSVLDVTFDNTKENWEDNDWLLVRTFKNKFDLIAKYPHLEDEIRGVPTKSELEDLPMYTFGVDETNDIAVYEFFHKRTESMPDGRYTMYVSPKGVLEDLPLPYEDIPIYRVAPGEILGTPFAYTPLFDLMPLQDAANMLYSTILTNQQAFGVQNIYVPRGADISMEALPGGLNIIEGNVNAGKPEPLNLTNTPKEVFEFLQMLIQTMETISGINSVVRGNPEANLRSGSALALIQSNSIQYMSGLAMEYNQLIEDVGTGMIKILKTYANTKRVAAIVGETNRSYLKEFSGDDLSNISRVVVSAGNPLSKTTAGRLQMASELLQYGLLTKPEQYISLIEQGNLGIITEEPIRHENLITSENEQLLEGELPPVLATDRHSQHINSHLALLDDARMRENPELVMVVLKHVEEHKEALMTTDPILLQIRGEQPIAPPMPPATQGADGNAAPGAMPNTAGAMDPTQLPSGVPAPATPPQGFEQAPVTGEQMQQQLRNQS